jgi:hypothetical protein
MGCQAKVRVAYESLKRSHDALYKQLSACDKYETDLLHFVEFESYNAAAGARALKQLKLNRKKRRAVKDEIAATDKLISQLRTYLENGSTEPENPKVYHYRTAEKEDILNVDVEQFCQQN